MPTGTEENYTILGAWDGDPERSILSYLTAIGQALLGHRVGETINLPDETGQSSRPVTIDGHRRPMSRGPVAA